jgi:hypothetical protein
MKLVLVYSREKSKIAQPFETLAPGRISLSSSESPDVGRKPCGNGFRREPRLPKVEFDL